MGKILVLVFFVEGLISYIINCLFLIDPDFYSMIFILINSLLFYVLLCKEKIDPLLLKVLVVLYNLKILWLIFMYMDTDFTVALFKQWDVLTFHQEALMVIKAQDPGYEMQFYSKIIGGIYFVFGENIRIPTYFNIVFSIYSILIFYKTLICLEIEDKIKRFCWLIYALLPWKNLMSVYMLREAIPSFFFVLSIYYFVRFLKNEKKKYFIYAVASSIVCLPFHSGLIPLSIIYFMFYISYDCEKMKISVSFSTMKRIGFVILFCVITLTFAQDELLAKFYIVGNSDEAFSAWSIRWTEHVDTGSLYLTWLQFHSVNELILQSPLRTVYFLYSPMPWDWRGWQDIVAFSLESMVQILGIIIVLKNFKYTSGKDELILKIFLINFILIAIVFGMGTYESGTALRHRAKFVSLLLCMIAISCNAKYKLKNH